MKILIVSKSDATGGAAIAAKRLVDALHTNGNSVKMLVQEKKTLDDNVYSTGESTLKKYWNLFLFIIERLFFYLFEKSKAIRFAFSPAVAGENISGNKLILEADIIHIHWFNQGFISLKGLGKIIKLKKPIVWTLHDMWAFTGGCHYSGNCKNYKKNCGNCIFLKRPEFDDLSNSVLSKKRKIIEGSKIQFVTCSNWLAEKAKESSLLSGFDIKAIPNPIDTSIFYPKEKKLVRQKLGLFMEKKLILFGAANIMDERKGLNYLLEALKSLKKEQPDMSSDVEIVVFGKSNDAFLSQIPFKVNNLGVLASEPNISDVYSAVDVFVLPSLEDNLPNTIMESLACGIPVVAFKSGGIPEMIDHKKNGYLAEFKSVEDLLNGINFILNEDSEKLKVAALQKVESSYQQKIIAEKYNLCYNSFGLL